MRDNTAEKARVAAEVAAATRDDPARVHRMLDTLDTKAMITQMPETTASFPLGDNTAPAAEDTYNPDAGRRRRQRMDVVAAGVRSRRQRNRMAAASRARNRGR